ncbi:hypothetical protein L6164_011793 [Bauhinia variegata]|uniref:Uncharacterized protein n=1 Tax=Bauhinia variegata TaxID=167791 RepID=A0ACB9PCC8_BAUVA|nr:hypothetical protein L6164_011793 [Bauhinia variegata]
MGRKPCCKDGVNKGAWSAKEDRILTNYIKVHGEGKWRDLPKRAGLNRCGKSCRLRWLNYLRPDIKRGNFSVDEEDLIIKLHKLIGNRWSLIAGRLPGRTDNEIKNHWNCYLSKKIKAKQSHIRPQDPSNGDSSKQKNSSSQVKEATDQAKPDDGSHPVIRTRAVRCTKFIDVPMPDAANDSAANATNSVTPEGEESQRPSLTIPNSDTNINSPGFFLDFDTSDIDLLLMPDPVDASGQCSSYQINGQFQDHLPRADHFADETMIVNNDDSVYEARSSGNWMVGGLFQQNEGPMDLFTILHSAHQYF